MTSDPPVLSDFVLGKLLSGGGMGSVWQAQHEATRLPGAVKVLTHPRYRESGHRVALRAELRALAALDHPGLSRVYAWGQISAEQAAALGPELVEGSPYVITDLCTGGDLARAKGRLAWLDLRDVLLAVLDALACAHGRGMLHRDIRPAKVLFGNARDARPGPRLIDMGLARPVDRLRAGLRERPAGAPAYMAPEQFTGLWRDWGPPTDLYALGCTAWEAVTGVVPFRGANVQAIRKAQLSAAPPMMRALMPVPEGLESWLRKLLEKSPSDRFPSAAAAAEALDKLDAPTFSAGWLPPPDDEDPLDPIVPWMGERLQPVCLLSPAERAALELPDAALLRSAEDASTAQARTRGSLLPMLGAAEAVEPLRRMGLVGRLAERRQLWQALQRARSDGPVLALVHGPASAGSSRLAAWIGERAGELGLAQTLWVPLSDQDPRGEGLRTLVRVALELGGLHEEGLRERVRERVQELGGDPWLHLALPDLLQPRPSLRPVLASASSRREATLGLLRLLTQRAPVVLVLDAVQHDPEALELASALLDEPDLPLLLVLTAQDEALNLRPEPAALLRELCVHPGTARIPLGPLPPEEALALCTQLAGGDDEGARALKERARGLPGVAVGLRRAWLTLGGLALTGAGLIPQAELEQLPQELNSATLAVLDHTLQGMSPEATTQLELAAVLGPHLEPDLWAAALAALPGEWTENLPERLADLGLLSAEPGAWRLDNKDLRAALRERARLAGRLEALHQAAARVLVDPAMKAEHLLAAGRADEALQPLLLAAREARLSGEPPLALRLLDRRDAIPGPAAALALGQLERLRVLLDLGDPQAAPLAQTLAAQPGPWQGPALALQSSNFLSAGDLDQADEAMSRAMPLLRASADDVEIAQALLVGGALALQRGEPDRARATYAEALRFAEAARDLPTALSALTWLGHEAGRRGALDQADSLHQRALQYATSLGDRLGEAHAYNGLAELARAREDLSRAEACYRRAVYLLESLGSPATDSVRLNLGLVLLRQHAWEEAGQLLDQAAVGLSAQGRAGFDALTGLFRLPCVAASGDWNALEARLGELAPMLRPGVFVDPDAAWSLNAAGQLALSAGRAGLARRLLGAAQQQWKALNRHSDAESTRMLLERLPAGT